MEKKAMAKTDTYVRGMGAINNFYAMLYAAMLEGMPGEKKIQPNGAYGWRGYQIDHYRNLAHGQYYCELYLGDPDSFIREDGSINPFTCRELVFQESYQDPHPKSVAQWEEKHGIEPGMYSYPFRVSLDLYRSRFFLMEKDEQYEMLKAFVSSATQQAVIWQNSKARKAVTDPEFLNGTRHNRRNAIQDSYDKVNHEFLFAWRMQDYLFNMLREQLDAFAKEAGLNILRLKQNDRPEQFRFRGLDLKFEGLFPGDRFDYRWAIYYEDQEYKFLGCSPTECTIDDRKLLQTYPLEKNTFFDLDEDQQKKELSKFIHRSIKA